MSGDIEIGNCQTCKKENVPVQRTYYRYPNVICSCCNGIHDPHFEITRHCHGCPPPPPPTLIKVHVNPHDITK